jgi:metal-responsive CopG/Arc/MetJ family transcriptional regulator
MGMDFSSIRLRFSRSLWKKIDDWRRQQEEIPPRSEAIRRLAEAGLAEEDKAKAKR